MFTHTSDMRNLALLFLFLPAVFSVNAQSSTPTGGCVYYGSIIEIIPTPENGNVLVNGQSYSVVITLGELMQPCGVTKNIQLGTLQIGDGGHYNMSYYYDTTTIKLDVFNLRPGHYTLWYILKKGFTDTMARMEVTVVNPPDTTKSNQSEEIKITTKSIDKNNLDQTNELILWPSPSNDILNLKMDNPNEPIYRAWILNAYGARVQTIYPNSAETTLSVKDLPGGMYTLQAQTAQQQLTRKFMVKH